MYSPLSIFSDIRDLDSGSKTSNCTPDLRGEDPYGTVEGFTPPSYHQRLR